MVCKKHGVPSDALLRGVLVPKCGERAPQTRRHLSVTTPVTVPGPSIGTHQGDSLFLSRHMLLRDLVVEACMSSDHELNEFGLLLDQFHAVVREGSDTIEDIFDAEFRRRFSELINRVAEPDRPDPEDLRKFHQLHG